MLAFSLTYPRHKSQSWAVSCLLAIPFNFIVCQPAFTCLMSLFVSVVLRKPACAVVHSGIMVKLRANIWRIRRLFAAHNLYDPPSDEMIDQANCRIHETHLIWDVVKDIVLTALFTALVSFVVYMMSPPGAYRVNPALHRVLIDDGSCTHGRGIALNKVKTVDELWLYLERTLLPAVYHNRSNYMTDRENYIVGAVRLRQLRVSRIASCVNPLAKQLNSSQTLCWLQLHPETEDKSRYTMFWNTAKTTGSDSRRTQTTDGVEKAWVYRSALTLNFLNSGLDSHPYMSGGYEMLLHPKMQTDLRKSIRRLREVDWIDVSTRIVYMELTTFNANTQLFTYVSVTFHINNIGLIETSHHLVTSSLEMPLSGRTLLICQIMFCILTALYGFKVLSTAISMRQNLLSYFAAPCVYIEWLTVLIAVYSMYTYQRREYFINNLLQQLENKQLRNDDSSFTDFMPAMYSHSLFINLLCSLLLLLPLKWLRIVQLTTYVKQIVSVIQCASYLVTVVFVTAFISVFVSFMYTYETMISHCQIYDNFLHAFLAHFLRFIHVTHITCDTPISDNAHWLLTVGAGCLLLPWLPILMRAWLHIFTVELLQNASEHYTEWSFKPSLFVQCRLLLWLGVWDIERFNKHLLGKTKRSNQLPTPYR